MTVTTVAPPEPTPADLDGVLNGLQASWTSTLTIKRQSTDDVGYREIIVSLDGESLAVLKHGDIVTHDIPPGKHRLLFNNTLFRKTIDFTINVGDVDEYDVGAVTGWAARPPKTTPAVASARPTIAAVWFAIIAPNFLPCGQLTPGAGTLPFARPGRSSISRWEGRV